MLWMTQLNRFKQISNTPLPVQLMPTGCFLSLRRTEQKFKRINKTSLPPGGHCQVSRRCGFMRGGASWGKRGTGTRRLQQLSLSTVRGELSGTRNFTLQKCPAETHPTPKTHTHTHTSINLNCKSALCLEIQPAFRHTGLVTAPKRPKKGGKTKRR